MDFNNKVMETLTAITENNEEDKQDLANLKQALIDGTFNVKYLTWAIMATNDENGNRIIDTYATIERLTQVLEALTQEISDRKAADDLEKKERKEETSAIINSVNQEISDRTNAVSVLNNLLTAETENRTSEDEKVLQYAQSVNEALGNAKTDLQGKIDSEAQTRLTSDNEIKASITSKEDSLKALINSVKNELNGYITTLNNRVNNLPTNYVFDTYESMTNDLLNASNTKYKVGDTLFIKEVNKPDYWVSAILSTKGTYGYYELSIQESKVDLSNYVKISELSREAIEEKFLETVENGTKSFAARSFTATNKNSGIDVNNYVEYGCDGVSFSKNGVKYPIAFPQKDGTFALISDIPQALKNPFALTINGQVYDGSSAVSITTETITEHDFVRFWHAGIEIQNDGTNNILRFSAFDTELEEFSPHISCQYDGPQYYWVWKFPQISGTFAMESQIPTKLSQLKNDGNYQTNTSDLKDNTATFTTASERSNVASGEKLSVLLGKIAKYFTDLKAIAFSGDRADIGLGNVDNTSDANKPVSNATQQALNNKANASDVYTKSETDGLLNDKANASETDNKINKSLYNLGYYDTITTNSDGTYTITRQTGYVDLGSLDFGYYAGVFYCLLPTKASSGTATNWLNAKYGNAPRGTDISISQDKTMQITQDGKHISIKDTTYTDANTFITAMHGVMLQYELATSYTEKVEKNHYATYNQDFILDHNKSEAERSANLFNNPYNYSGTNNGVSINVVGNECTLNGTSTNGFYQTLGYFNLKAGTYTYNQIVLSGSISGNISQVKFGLVKSDGSSFPLGELTGTYTLTQDTTLYIVVWFGSAGITFNNCKLVYMLNEGSAPLPYQPYEGKVVHEKGLENYRKNIYTTSLDANAIYNSSNYYGYGITNAPSSYGNLLTFQYANKNDIPNFAIQLFLDQSSNIGDPSIFIRGSTSDAYTSWKRLAFASEIPTIPTFKTINGNSIVGSGDLTITPGIFTLVGNNVNTLTISKNETYFITSVEALPIYVEGNSGISFYGSSLVSTVGLLGGSPRICLNGSAYTLDSNSVTLKSDGLFKAYKVN